MSCFSVAFCQGIRTISCLSSSGFSVTATGIFPLPPQPFLPVSSVLSFQTPCTHSFINFPYLLSSLPPPPTSSSYLTLLSSAFYGCLSSPYPQLLLSTHLLFLTSLAPHLLNLPCTPLLILFIFLSPSYQQYPLLLSSRPPPLPRLPIPL